MDKLNKNLKDEAILRCILYIKLDKNEKLFSEESLEELKASADENSMRGKEIKTLNEDTQKYNSKNHARNKTDQKFCQIQKYFILTLV